MITKTLDPDQFCSWDAFVDESPQGDIFCYSWWLDAITKSNFKILAIFENNEIVAGIPLAFDAQHKVNEPPLTRTLGVLFKGGEYTSRLKQTSAERKWLYELLEHIPDDDFVQMCMHHNFTDWLPFRWKGFRQTTRYTYIIDFDKKTIADLFSNLDRLRKRMIRRAEENDIRVELTDDFNLIYQYEALTYERQGLKFRIPYNDLKLLDDSIISRGKRAIFRASDKSGTVHAVLYVAFNNNSAYALLSGSDPKLREKGGHTLVMWEAVKYFSDKVKYFNFGGSDIERIENHIRGYGGIITPYFHIYNEKLMADKTGIRYHLGEVYFHLSGITKTIRNRIFTYFRLN